MPVKLILERPRQGGDFLAAFILRTSGRDLQCSDLSTIQSARAERLESLSAASCREESRDGAECSQT